MKISTTVKTKKGYVWIDTTSLDNPIGRNLDRVGLGNDDAVGSSFETMVFKSDKEGEVKGWEDLDKDNYNTEKEAKAGHKKMVKKWKLK